VSRNDDLEEIAQSIASLSERVGDLAYDALREQLNGDGDSKATERTLNSVRRALVKAENGLRDLIR
jgi:negative regulator of replication initiation